jgi:adenylate kinase
MSLIALTGVPGTGKSTVSRILRSSDHTVYDLNLLVKEHGLVLGIDRKRGSKEVDLRSLGRLVKKLDVKGDTIFLEGHLSHLLPVDRAIVLRCHPEVLRKRLKARRWPMAKVRENLEAEAMGVITRECVGARLDCYEIDVSNIKPHDVASLVSRLARSRRGVMGYKPGKIDYFEEILKWY